MQETAIFLSMLISKTMPSNSRLI